MDKLEEKLSKHIQEKHQKSLTLLKTILGLGQKTATILLVMIIIPFPPQNYSIKCAFLCYISL